MKCSECERKISIWDVVLPWRESYVLLITDDGKVVDKERLCKKCANSFMLLERMCRLLGENRVKEILEKGNEE